MGRYNWQLKRINSETGPVGTTLSDAIRSQYSVPGQTEVLWTSDGSGEFKQKIHVFSVQMLR